MSIEFDEPTTSLFLPYTQERITKPQLMKESNDACQEVPIAPIATLKPESESKESSPRNSGLPVPPQTVETLPSLPVLGPAGNVSSETRQTGQDQKSTEDTLYGLSAAFSDTGSQTQGMTTESSRPVTSSTNDQRSGTMNYMNQPQQTVVWLPVPITTNGAGFPQYMPGMAPEGLQVNPGMQFQMGPNASMDVLGAVRRLNEAHGLDQGQHPKKRKRKNRLCANESCSKNARGRTQFCVRHGGGSRCTVEGCEKGARPHSQFCSAHGGGHRCLYSGCKKGALAKSVYCRRHGKAAASSSNGNMSPSA